MEPVAFCVLNFSLALKKHWRDNWEQKKVCVLLSSGQGLRRGYTSVSSDLQVSESGNWVYANKSHCQYVSEPFLDNLFTIAVLPMAVPWLRRLVTGFSLQRSVHVGFVVDKVALGQVSVRVLRFPLSVSFHRGSSCVSGGEQHASWWTQFRDIASPHPHEQRQVVLTMTLSVGLWTSLLLGSMFFDLVLYTLFMKWINDKEDRLGPSCYQIFELRKVFNKLGIGAELRFSVRI
jgi:hypothetical protein